MHQYNSVIETSIDFLVVEFGYKFDICELLWFCESSSRENSLPSIITRFSSLFRSIVSLSFISQNKVSRSSDPL